MLPFILEETSHCWDLWKYAGCSAINSVYFPLTKTCQHSSSLTWVYLPARGLHKCLCPPSAETSLRFRHWCLCWLLGSVIEPGSHSCPFWSLFSSETPLPGHLSLSPLSLLLWQVSAFLRYSNFCRIFVSAHLISIHLLFIRTAHRLCKLLCLNELLVTLLMAPEFLLALSCIYMVPFSSVNSNSKNKCKCVSLQPPVFLWAGSWLRAESTFCSWSLGEDSTQTKWHKEGARIQSHHRSENTPMYYLE